MTRSTLRGLWPLVALGAAAVAVEALSFTRLFPLDRWWRYALLDYAWLTQYELSGQIGFFGALALLFVLYYLALVRLRTQPERGPLWLILLIQSGLGLALVNMYPVAAIDLYDYVLYARLALYWGANPLVEPPSHFPTEPMVGFSYWPNEPSVYGPLWQVVSERLVLSVDGQLPAALFAFKLLALAASLGVTVLIWLTLHRVDPPLAPAGALLYAWNPLQQFETAGNGHNDALMVLLLALAIWLLSRGWRALVFPAFCAGLLVKITLAPLTPLLALAPLFPVTGKRRWPAAAAGLALSALLVVVLYQPYWEGRASLPFLDRGNWFTASPPTLLRELLRRYQDFETAGRTAATLCGVLFALGAPALLARFAREAWRTSTDRALASLVRFAYHTFFLYLVLACLWWQPWYLLTLLLLAALSGDVGLGDRANLFCLGGLLSYGVFKYIWAVHQADWNLDYTRIMALSVIVIFTPPLLHLLASLGRGQLGWSAWRASAPSHQST